MYAILIALFLLDATLAILGIGIGGPIGILCLIILVLLFMMAIQVVHDLRDD